MSQYLLINRIKVQGANAISGFTWGFPAITHFLGFTHNLARKLQKHSELSDIQLSGCAVVVHQHQVHTYGYNQFIQSKNPAYQYGEDPKNKVGSPPIIEEGKMNMTVSLLVGCDGNVGNREEAMKKWLLNRCRRQRLAGGTVLEIGGIELFTIDDGQNNNLRALTRKLLPGFILQDRSAYLEKHVKGLQKKNEQATYGESAIRLPGPGRIYGFCPGPGRVHRGPELCAAGGGRQLLMARVRAGAPGRAG